MKEKIFSFEDWQVGLVSLRLQMENNAFLRVVLGNQLQIMEKLKIDTTFPDEIFNDVMPVTKHAEINSTYEKYLENIKTITSLLHERSWQYAQLKLSVKDKVLDE